MYIITDSDKTFYQINIYIFTLKDVFGLFSVYKCKLNPAFIYNGNKNLDVYSGVNLPTSGLFYYYFGLPDVIYYVFV